MLAQARAELNKKKGLSNVVIAVFFILLSLIAVSTLWIATKQLIMKSPIEKSCFDYFGMSIEKACYLGQDEVLVEVNRNFEKINIEYMDFQLLPGNAIWEITGKKCSDARFLNTKYGGYCSLIDEGAVFSYVFNVSGLDRQEEAMLGVYNGYQLCSIGSEEIKNSC